MRIALLSDIHGHLVPFEAVLADLQNDSPDQIVCLGDVAATGPRPRAVIERLRALDPQPYEGDDDTWQRFTEIDQWCAGQLSAEWVLKDRLIN